MSTYPIGNVDGSGAVWVFDYSSTVATSCVGVMAQPHSGDKSSKSIDNVERQSERARENGATHPSLTNGTRVLWVNLYR